MTPIYPTGLDIASPQNAWMAIRRRARENTGMRNYSPTSREAVSDRLVWTRQALGLNQKQFSELLGVDARKWNHYEVHKVRISIDVALRVCEVTGVNLDWIYRGEEAMLPLKLIDGIRRASAEADQEDAPDRRRARL